MTYFSKNLSHFVSELIRENKKIVMGEYCLNVHDLDDLDKYRFAMHLIENDDRDLFSLYENDKYDDVVISLLRMLDKDNTQSKLNFAENVRDKIVNYYLTTMQLIIDEFIDILEYEERIEKGHSPRYRQDNGERYWVKSL